jgi:hypothetical protein
VRRYFLRRRRASCCAFSVAWSESSRAFTAASASTDRAASRPPLADFLRRALVDLRPRRQCQFHVHSFTARPLARLPVPHQAGNGRGVVPRQRVETPGRTDERETTEMTEMADSKHTPPAPRPSGRSVEASAEAECRPGADARRRVRRGPGVLLGAAPTRLSVPVNPSGSENFECRRQVSLVHSVDSAHLKRALGASAH